MTRSSYYYLMVTKDKYELPLVVVDTPSELAKISGCTAECIMSIIYKWERRGGGQMCYRKARKAEGTFRRVRR